MEAVLPSEDEDGFQRARGDGTFTQVVRGTERPYEVPRSQVRELRHLLRLGLAVLLPVKPTQTLRARHRGRCSLT
jgi:hypothetical protein